MGWKKEETGPGEASNEVEKDNINNANVRRDNVVNFGETYVRKCNHGQNVEKEKMRLILRLKRIAECGALWQRRKNTTRK